jgi:hypothetical protein
MKTIHEQINRNPEDVAGAFEANFFPREIAVYQQALRNVMAVWEQLRLIQAEGAVEVTVRSLSTTVTLGVNRDLGATIVQDMHDTVGADAHRISGLIDRLHADLARDGESADRIHMLELLLTPVGRDGKALQQPTSEPATQGPFLAPSTPPTRPRRRAA